MAFVCMTVLRFAIHAPCATSLILSLTRSQLRNLLSMARLNWARSRVLFDICNQIRIAQTSLSFSGGFCPVSFPLFQGVWCGLSCVRYNMGGLHIDDGNLLIIMKYGLISRATVNVCFCCYLWCQKKSFRGSYVLDREEALSDLNVCFVK